MKDFNLDSVITFFKGISFVQIMRIGLIFLGGIILIRLIQIFFLKIIFRKSNLQSQMMIKKIVNYTGFLLLLIIVLSELGISLTALLGAAGILGLAIGVASQKSLGNIISGFFMVTEKSFEIGDVITVGDKTGIVHSVTLLSVMLKTFDNLLIRIPNETLISTDIINITKFPIRRMDIVVSVGYKSDMDIVLKTLTRIGKENIFCLDDPAPMILITSLADSGIVIKFGVWFDKSQYIETRNSVMSDILNKFRKENILIPFPQITVNYPEQTQNSNSVAKN